MAMADYDLSDVAAVIGNRNGSGMFSNGDGLLWLLFILILGNGWGGNRGMGGAGNVGGDALYPWMNLQQGFTEILQSLCGGFANVTAAITNGFANAETAATARQMADMNQMFGMQTAITQGINGLGMGVMQGFSGQQMQLAGLGADIAREACANRQVVSDGVRDILANQTAVGQRQIDNQNQWGQRVIDWLCADRDARKDETIAELRQQIALKDLAASQNLQTAQLAADNAAQTAALEQYLAPVPRPAYVVQNPNCCQNNGCGGCGYAA